MLADISTVYVGGGTPTVLGGKLLDVVDAVSRWCLPCEFTCEANPESFTEEMARSLSDRGVTRISLGVQSFNDRELSGIGRIHSASVAAEAIARAKRFGFDVSADLMCGIPYQSASSWSESLDRLVGLGVDHVSVYPLAIEEGTPLERMASNDPELEPDEDFQADCMLAAREVLESRGYRRYEVASYAREGKRCRHNIAYWCGISYLGIGRSASGMLNGSQARRLSVFFPGIEVPSADSRVRMTQLDDAGARFDYEVLGPREAAAEDLMLACRMADGISSELLDSARRSIPASELEAACARATELGLVRKVPSVHPAYRLEPTDRGWLDGNVLFELFWNLADVSATM